MIGMTGRTGTVRRGVRPSPTALGYRARLVCTMVLLLGLTSGVIGCGALDVSDPTAIEDQELNDATGAALLREGALRVLSGVTDDGAYAGGLLADEFLSDPPSWYQQYGLISPDEVLDRRESMPFELLGDAGGYGGWQGLRHAASVALPKLRAYLPTGVAEAKVGEMFALRGFGTLRLAEDFCPGFPLHEMVNYEMIYGSPLSTEAALEHALADFDSAIAYAADSARILHFAQVGRARTLLALGRFDEAGAAAADVPIDYVAQAEYLAGVGVQNGALAFGDLSKSVANQEGGTGLDFVAATDPRVETDSLGLALDGATGIYGLTKYNVTTYPGLDVPIVLASGIEARLIEAEAALHSGDASWLTTLNALRTTQVTPALADTTDPGTADARVNLLFRERAFWLFATGHRLADLRRLVRVYGRSAESVFPTGAYRLGGSYGTATSIPFPAAQETPFNPAVTGCTSR